MPFTREKKGNAALSSVSACEISEVESQHCCEPILIEALAAVMILTRSVSKWLLLCRARRLPVQALVPLGLVCSLCVAQEGNKTQRFYHRLQSSDGYGILKFRV